MSDTLVLFLPGEAGGWRWLRLRDGAVADRGEGVPADAADMSPPPTVIAPPAAVTLHWAELPAASERQAAAAARLLAIEASAAPPAGLHVAIGRDGVGAERPIGVVASTLMQEWLDQLAGHRVDPAAIVPAPLLLPSPDQGYVRADLGGEGVVRGVASGFADDPVLTGLVTDETPAEVERAALENAIVAAVADPPLDLRQGVFARRRRLSLDWALLRRLGWLAAAILLVSLSISAVRIMRYSFGADAIAARADAVARTGLARGEPVNDADRQLDARLAGLRGPGQGFTVTGAALSTAVQATAGTELTALAFDPDGTLRATVSAETEGQASALRDALITSGFVATLSTLTATGGRVSGELTVRPA